MIVLVLAEIPIAGLDSFEAYEDAVLPLLTDHGGRLLDRFRAERAEGYLEVHLVEFATATGLDSYRSDTRRAAAHPLMQESGAVVEVVEAHRV